MKTFFKTIGVLLVITFAGYVASDMTAAEITGGITLSESFKQGLIMLCFTGGLYLLYKRFG